MTQRNQLSRAVCRLGRFSLRPGHVVASTSCPRIESQLNDGESKSPP